MVVVKNKCKQNVYILISDSVSRQIHLIYIYNGSQLVREKYIYTKLGMASPTKT
jgi:hypothetical protein